MRVHMLAYSAVVGLIVWAGLVYGVLVLGHEGGRRMWGAWL